MLRHTQQPAMNFPWGTKTMSDGSQETIAEETVVARLGEMTGG